MNIKITCKGNKYVPLDSLKNFQGNLKNLGRTELESLKRSILKHGFSFPVFVWGDQILDGHQRVFATKQLLNAGHSIDKIPVVEIDARDKAEAAEKLLFLNSAYAKITDDGLYEFLNANELNIEDFVNDLNLPEFDMDQFLAGFINDEEKTGLTDDDEIPEVPEEPITKTGDLWLLGDHRLLCGDSTNIEDVERLMNGAKADMVFTDPPYGVNYDGGIQFSKGGVKKGSRVKLENDHSDDIYSAVIPILAKFCNGPCYVWFAGTKASKLYDSVESVGEIHSLLIWVKNGGYGALNANYKQKHEPCLYWKPKGKKLNFVGATTETTIWDINKDGVNKLHPTQKPVSLPEKAIRNHSIGLVLDLFLGSGSTLIASEKTNRKCYGMEIDPHYCDVIIKRWEDFTGKKAVKV